MKGTRDSETGKRGVARRRFLETAGATGAALALAGCGGGSDEGGPITLTADQEWADAQDTVIDSLRDAGLSEDIELEIEAGDFETGARRSEFVSALDAGRADPDIFMMDSGWTIPFIVREQVVNLEEEMSEDKLSFVKDNYLESAIQTASDPDSGDLFGLPLFPDYPVMHYRKDLVEEAGYDPEGENWSTTPMTWDRFAQIAADAWEQSDATYGFTTQGANYEGTSCCTFNEMMTSWGGAYFGDHENLFGPVGDRPITVDEAPVKNTIRMMRSFMRGPDAEDTLDGFPQITNTDLIEFTEEPSREPFTGGNSVFHRNWPYAIALNLDNGDFDASDYDVMPMPYGVEEGEGNYAGTGGTNHALGGWHLTVNPNSESVGDAVSVLEAFANEDVMRTVLEELGNQPPIPEVAENADASSVGAIGEYLDTLAIAARNTVPRPVTAVWPDESPRISDEIHAAYRGEKTADQAMSDLVGRIEEIENSA